MFGILNIKGIALDNKQLEKYIEKFASDNILKNNSDLNTFPIEKLMLNFEFITKVYNLLNEHIKLNINIHPAGEWLLDNYYIIEENVKMVQKDLTKKKYKNLISIDNGNYSGFARIYVLAGEILAYTENNVNENNLKLALKAYQKKKSLSMDEIWNIGLFLKIILIQNITDICEKIYEAQELKYRAEFLVERFVENKRNYTYIEDNKKRTKKIGYGKLKYPFIEHLSYKLKSIGKKGKAFLDILEDQVNKMGTSISEVIKMEHYEIAINKISMANSITTIKRLNRMNFQDIFEEINGVEEILKEEPLRIYENMDYLTKETYRKKIQNISKETKISEIYISKKLVQLANYAFNENLNEKKMHIGYYLISDGINDLYAALDINKKKKISNKSKQKIYVFILFLLSICLTLISTCNLVEKLNIICYLLLNIFLFFPISEIVVQIVQYILGKSIQPKRLPKMDFSKGIPKDSATFVVIPTIINSKEKVKELLHKLEVFYLANKSENIYFALLGDCTCSKREKENIDKDIMNFGNELIYILNEKYKSQDFPKFHFLYRKRVWNEKECSFLGWERKRGLLTQFNQYILNKNNSDFIVNTIKNNIDEMPKIKYIITLDADTDLTLNSAQKLIGTMEHILNKPVIKDGVVVEGHGLIQPKVGININASRKSLFTQIFAGAGGTDLYTNAIFDIYQDNFDEGIYTGKGIYNLEVFEKVLNKQIPEDTVLSHDLLEGNYLRCGLASDILLMDGYPYKYNSFMSRLNRWIRGDWQITRWLQNNIKDDEDNKIKNPLKFLSKFKILDNLRRSLFEINVILVLIFSLILKNIDNIKIDNLIIISLISIIIPMILEFFDSVFMKKNGKENVFTFTPKISGIKGIFIRALLTILFLPHKAYISLNAIIKTIYRKYVSKKNLLEWTTSEDAEKNSKTDLLSYYKLMIINVIFSIVAFILMIYTNNISVKIIYCIFGTLWAVSPYLAYFISKEIIKKPKIESVLEQDINYVNEIGKDTWKFFKESIIEENNFLPPDNYQENRKTKFVDRTSSTNIGLGLLSVISSYDLKYENLEYVIDTLEKMLNTINGLQKWNGHLYNWYNIKTLEPLVPRYVSTVDSGNFIGYLYVVKSFLEEIKEQNENIIKEKAKYLIEIITNIIIRTDFKPLYDYKIGLFSIGYNVEDNQLTDSYYDLLASEARQASLIAISKGDVPYRHWRNLSRTLTSLNKYKGLISWSGTAFEYLMPNINIPNYEGSLLDESCKFLIMSQMEYSKKIGIPWGISESAFNLKDLNSNYQYKSFGIPWLGLKRGLSDDLVVASYGSMLWIANEPNKVIKNIRQLEKEGARGKYGLYESIDFTRDRLAYGKNSEVVKTFMAHHQGLILLSINNLINDMILQKRFIRNPEIESVDIILQERMPENVIITKEKKEKPNKIKYQDYENYIETIFNKPEYEVDKYNVISNENYSVIMNQKGEGYSKYKDILINRYKETSENLQGIFFYIKDINSKKIWSSNYTNFLDKPDKYFVKYSPDKTQITRIDGDIETTSKVTIDCENPIEVRELTIKNNGIKEVILEITSNFECIISNQTQDIAHPAFNNLFLRYYFENNNLIIERKNREKNVEKTFVATCLYTENETIGELEYEIDKEKFFGRGNFRLPKMVEESRTFSKNTGLVTEPIIAMKRTIKIKPGEKVKLNLVIAVSDNKDDVINKINDYKNQSVIDKNFDLQKIKSSEEIRFLGVKGKDIETFKRLLSLLIVQNNIKKINMKKYKDKEYFQEDLWKFGLSGELPILLVKIKDLNDSYIVDEILKAYEYFRLKNFEIDLVILNEEKYSYNSYAYEEIENCILNRQLSYLKNIKSGIFIINSKEISIEDLELLEFKANVILDCHLGSLKTQLEDMEEDYINSIKNIGEDVSQKIILEDEIIRTSMIEDKDNIDNYKYFNEYGAFSKDGREYIIKVNKDNNLPTTWSHILANENFGTIVTEGMGGYTWSQNSRLNRITAWNNNPSQDIPSEIIYLKDIESGKYWSLGSRPTPDNNDYNITYGFGYAIYEHTSLGIEQKLTTFVPNKEKVKINILKLKNILPNSKKLKLIYYIKQVLGEDESKTNGFIKVNKDSNIVYFENKYIQDLRSGIGYISTSENIKSFTGNKNSFVGKGNIATPDAINKISLDNESGLGNNSCVAIEFEIEVSAFEEKDIVILLGEEEKELNIKDVVYKYTNLINCKNELQKVKDKWTKLIEKIQINTPIESMNILLNGWSLYQTMSSRLNGRTGYYQSGGAYGFRDQLQDTLCLKYIEPEIMKNQIIKHAKHQFIEGDVLHWWHEETQKGIRTKFSDDLLWLVFITNEYIKTTGDKDILNIELPFLKGDLLDENTNEKYEKYLETNEKETLYNHLKKAIDKSLNFGENELPKIGSGDWNDGFSEVGSKGIGESVWLGFFLYSIIDGFIKIMKDIKIEGQNSNIEIEIKRYEKVMQELKKALNANAWDGRWYKRAFTDDGKVLGSIENKECRIDNIAQSWSVISNAGDNDKKYISMESMENHLVDRENSIIKLLDPPFDKGDLEPGYIKAYLPGVRENGGQYTHGAVWAIIAETMLGFGDKAIEFFKILNPIEHSRTKEAAQKYKVEPYVIAADIYGAENLIGRGGWTWYTGASSWLYTAGIEYILGLKIEDGFLRINPTIPKEWKEYSIKYKYKESIYNIKVQNPNSKNTGIEKFLLNNIEIPEKKIKLINDGKIYNIDIIM